MTTTKHCSKCDTDKPLTDEHWIPRKEGKDGYRGYCRECWYAQQRPGKRRHYRRHADRIRAERRADRKRNPERRRLNDLHYYLRHREKKLAYNRRYYWKNHERLLAYARWYARNVRPLRVDLGESMPNTRNVDMHIWQEQQSRQQAQQFATAILILTMQALTEEERRLLLAFEAHGYDLENSAVALEMSVIEAEKLMRGIRHAATRARDCIAAD